LQTVFHDLTVWYLKIQRILLSGTSYELSGGGMKILSYIAIENCGITT
jgi:hypothetical protein